PHFLAAAGNHQGGDVPLGGQDVTIADLLGVDTEEITGVGVGVGLAAAIDAVGGNALVDGAAGINPVAGTRYHTFGFAADDVRCGLQLFGVIHDPTGVEEGVDGLQRNGRDGLGNRRGAHRRRQADGATLAAI